MIECQKKPERELKKRLGGNVEETGRSVSNLKFLFICQWILEGRAYYGESSVKELKLATVRVTNRMEAGRRPWATCCTAYYLQRNQISLCRRRLCISSCLWPLVMFRSTGIYIVKHVSWYYSVKELRLATVTNSWVDGGGSTASSWQQSLTRSQDII